MLIYAHPFLIQNLKGKDTKNLRHLASLKRKNKIDREGVSPKFWRNGDV